MGVFVGVSGRGGGFWGLGMQGFRALIIVFLFYRVLERYPRDSNIPPIIKEYSLNHIRDPTRI